MLNIPRFDYRGSHDYFNISRKVAVLKNDHIIDILSVLPNFQLDHILELKAPLDQVAWTTAVKFTHSNLHGVCKTSILFRRDKHCVHYQEIVFFALVFSFLDTHSNSIAHPTFPWLCKEQSDPEG